MWYDGLWLFRNNRAPDLRCREVWRAESGGSDVKRGASDVVLSATRETTRLTELDHGLGNDKPRLLPISNSHKPVIVR
jgi:hypothetical protein